MYCVEHRDPMKLTDKEHWQLGTTVEAVGWPATIALSNLKSLLAIFFEIANKDHLSTCTTLQDSTV